MHPIRLHWTGSLFDLGSCAAQARLWIRTLADAGVQLTIQPTDSDRRFLERCSPSERDRWLRRIGPAVDGGIFLCHCPPLGLDGVDVYQHYRRTQPGQRCHIGLTTFETDRLPPRWASACNGMDEIWVPNQFNGDTFVRAGVDRDRIHVVPTGIDTTVFDPETVEPFPLSQADHFTFLFVGGWTHREGSDVLLRAYHRAFDAQDPVRLILRTTSAAGDDPSCSDQRLDGVLQELGIHRRQMPPIVILDAPLSESQIRSLYRAADAFVLPTRGEGWGLPIMEAMAMRLPVITTRWGGTLDYVNDSNGLLIDIEGLVPVELSQTRENPFYTADHRWAEPSVTRTATLMREVYEAPEMARPRAIQARHDIASRWSPQQTTRWLLERLEANSQRRVRSVATHAGGRTDGTSSETRTPVVREDLFVCWHAPLSGHHGCAEEACQFVLGLDAIGVPVRTVPPSGGQPVAERSAPDDADLLRLSQAFVGNGIRQRVDVFHTSPDQFPHDQGAGPRIGRTVVTTDRLPGGWVEACNRMDEIWVPNQFNRAVLASSGVHAEKLVVVPGAIDTQRFHSDAVARPFQGQRGFTFLSMFDWTLRKGWDVLLRAFAEEFAAGEDVTLVMKVWSSRGLQLRRIQQAALEHLRSCGIRDDHQPNILLLESEIPSSQLPSVYRAVDAYVLPSRGEGCARTLMEAMSMGLPTIATRWSGQTEFMNDTNSYLVDCHLQSVPDCALAEVPALAGHRWAEPSREHLRAVIREVFERRAEAERRGAEAQREVRNRFDRIRVAQIVQENLDRLAKTYSSPGPTDILAVPDEAAAGVTTRVIWEGDQLVNHSLAIVNRELCLRLLSRGIQVGVNRESAGDPGLEGNPRYRPLLEHGMDRDGDAEVHVRHRWPPDFAPPDDGRLVIMQPWEYYSLPRTWVEPMSRNASEIWVPTHFVRDGYLHSGIPPEKVHVIPCGVDCDRFQPSAEPLKLNTSRRFRFLFVGGTLIRKGIDLLLRAYLGNFQDSDDVCLVIKDMGTHSFYRGQTFADQIRHCMALPQAPEIEYIDRDLDQHALAGLYAACDGLVHPFRAEGFGLPIAEAMATGLAVITTRYGAALDFCDDECNYLIDAREIRYTQRRVANLETVDFPRVAAADITHLGKLMRRVVDNPGERREKGVRARERIRREFTWEQAAEKVMNRLDAISSAATLTR